VDPVDVVAHPAQQPAHATLDALHQLAGVAHGAATVWQKSILIAIVYSRS
jgi:hypothetical protein